MGARTILGDVVRMARGVRCQHDLRFRKCIACGVKVDGVAYIEVLHLLLTRAGVEPAREIVQPVLTSVLDEVARRQGGKVKP